MDNFLPQGIKCAQPRKQISRYSAKETWLVMKTEYTIVAYISPDRSNTPICLYYCESWSSAYGINSLIACRPALHMCRWNIYASNSNNVGSWNSVVRNKTTSGPRTLFFGRQSLDGAGVVTGSRRDIKCRTPAINCTPERRLMSIYRPYNTPTPCMISGLPVPLSSSSCVQCACPSLS